jgi:hypothetical protein
MGQPAIAIACVVVALAACGAGGFGQAAGSAASLPAIDGVVTGAEHIYGNEINGHRAYTDLAFVAGNQTLLAQLDRSELVAAQAYAQRLMTGNRTVRALHITRISVIAGGRALINAVWNSNGAFVVAPVTRVLRYHGRTLGTLLVSVQDVVGFVRLIGRDLGAQAVVRGSSGQVRTSLPAAASVKLPSSGSATIAGTHYEVGSFHLGGWGGETLTVWVLKAP